MSTQVVFLRPWRGRVPGQTSDELGGGVAAALAQRGIVRITSAPKPKGVFERFKRKPAAAKKPPARQPAAESTAVPPASEPAALES